MAQDKSGCDAGIEYLSVVSRANTTALSNTQEDRRPRARARIGRGHERYLEYALHVDANRELGIYHPQYHYSALLIPPTTTTSHEPNETHDRQISTPFLSLVLCTLVFPLSRPSRPLMPSALNSFFKPGGLSSRRSSVTTSSAGSASQQQQHQRVSSSSSITSADQLPGKSGTASPGKQQQQQRSLPALDVSQSALERRRTREPVAKSESFPSIEVVSPTGTNPRHLWGPGDRGENDNRSLGSSQHRVGSPSLGEVAQLAGSNPSSQGSNNSDDRTPLAERGPVNFFSEGGPPQTRKQQASPVHHSDDEDDPLYSFSKSTTSNMPRPVSGGGKPSTGAFPKRGAKADVPDRHDIMRRAMAEATTSDTFGMGNGLGVPTQSPQSTLDVGKPSNGEADGSPAAARGGGAQGASQSSQSGRPQPAHPTQDASQGTFIDHGGLGEGSLSIQDFANIRGDGEVVVADSAAKAASDTDRPPPSEGRAPQAADNGKFKMFPSRPKLGSRASSFRSDVSADNSPEQSLSGHAPFSSTPSTSPVKAKTAGHAKYATTGTAADPVRSKQTSLAVPGSNGVLDAASADPRHHMHESASTGSMNVSPLSRFRRLSDSGSTHGKKGASPSGGIAGALAASGAAGMGVGTPDLSQMSRSSFHEAREPRKSVSRSRQNSNVYRDFVGASQGGIYRDPTTGKMVERGPDTRKADDNRLDMLRSRSGTGNSSISQDGSDVSAASGLNAAANFARGLQHASHDANRNLLTPEAIFGGHGAGNLDDAARQLTPNGIGAVGGLSPSGLGERVERGEDDDGWPDEDVDAQITGFAVASSKRNAEFHSVFPNVPEDDYLIEDYGCALVREILIQGRLYISENHVCFHANIFGWVSNYVIPFSEIVSIEKRMTAYVIPNAIQVATLHSKHTFASFLSRDTTYDIVVNIWKLSHPALPTVESQADILTDEESVESPEYEGDAVKSKSEAEGLSQPTPVKKSKRKILKKKLGIKDGGADGHSIGAAVTVPELAAAIARAKSPAPSGKRQPHRKTTCTCEKEKKHFTNVVLDTTYPTKPEKLYNLIFTSGFMKDFWTDNQKLSELQMSDWAPSAANNNILSREISYIKPLAGGFGPKQTKCYLADQNEHVDFDEYVTTVTTTRTPDVPSGGSFSVKTRTCITWDGGNVSHMYVSCMVEWTGRSMVKGIIDRACIDGQKQYYKDLDGAIRSYIKEHASEFREEGEDPEAVRVAIEEDDSQAKASQKDATAAPIEAKEGLAKYIGMAQEAGTTVVETITGAFEMVSDLLGGVSPKMLVLGFIVILLILSNLLSLRSTSARDPTDPHRLRSAHNGSKGAGSTLQSAGHYGHDAALHAATSAEAVAHAVRDVLHDYFEPHSAHTPSGRVPHMRLPDVFHRQHGAPSSDPATEIQKLLGVLDNVEARVGSLRDVLQKLQAQTAQTQSSNDSPKSAEPVSKSEF